MRGGVRKLIFSERIAEKLGWFADGWMDENLSER